MILQSKETNNILYNEKSVNILLCHPTAGIDENLVKEMDPCEGPYQVICILEMITN